MKENVSGCHIVWFFFYYFVSLKNTLNSQRIHRLKSVLLITNTNYPDTLMIFPLTNSCLSFIWARFVNVSLPTYSGVPRISLSSPTPPSLRARPKSTIFISPGGDRLVRRMFCGWGTNRKGARGEHQEMDYYYLMTDHSKATADIDLLLLLSTRLLV